MCVFGIGALVQCREHRRRDESGKQRYISIEGNKGAAASPQKKMGAGINDGE